MKFGKQNHRLHMARYVHLNVSGRDSSPKHINRFHGNISTGIFIIHGDARKREYIHGSLSSL